MPSKRDAKGEQECLDWIGAVIGQPLGSSFEDALFDGVILCQLMNTLMPGSVPKYNKKPKMKMMMMENCSWFQEGAKKYGLPDREVFQSVDLVDKRNIPQVHICIMSLARMAQTKPDYTGPVMGPKMAQENKREFTQEQMDAGKYEVNTFQMGYNKGASASGVNMGQTRHM